MSGYAGERLRLGACRQLFEHSAIGASNWLGNRRHDAAAAMMPRLTIPHYFDFGEDRSEVGDELSSAQGWDALRLRTAGPFGMATDAAAWAETAQAHPELQSRAAAVADRVRALGGTSLASYGVGGASLEYWLMRDATDLSMTVTEYAPETYRVLSSYLPGVNVVQHDLLADDPLDAGLHLFHRIDTEFTNPQFKQLMSKFASVTVIVVATRLLTWRDLRHELRQRRNPNATGAGVYRTRAAFEALWKPTHLAERASFADLDGWVLRPR